MKVLDPQQRQKAEHLDAEALIQQAHQRQRRRWVVAITVGVVIVTGAVAYGLSGSGGSRSRTTTPSLTPASILARAKSGIEGTFSAVYKLSGPPSSAISAATVIVAQRAPAGATPWPGSKPGEWSYRLTYANGSSVEWVVRGNFVGDCWREHTSKWRCSAGDNGDAGGIGYEIATIPYLPGTAFQSISIALENMPRNKALATRSGQSSFGPLTCLRDTEGTWCLMGNGHLATFTGVGFVGYAWTKARLVSERTAAPAADFVLSGIPKAPFLLPPAA